MPQTPYLKEPATTRFFAGGLSEAEALLGSPLPRLPPPEIEEGREVYLVHFDPRLRGLARKCILGFLTQIGVHVPYRAPGDAAAEQQEYEGLVARALRAARAADRKRGLANLFWLAHSLDVALFLRDLEHKAPAVKKGKYSLFPLLSSLYRRLDQAIRKESCTEASSSAVAPGGGLVESIIEDGFAFFETSAADLNLNEFLPFNRRFRMPADVFFELQTALLKEAERRVREGDRAFLARIAKNLPGLPKDHYLKPVGLLKIAFNYQIVPYLLGDAWNVGTRLLASAPLKAEVERRKPAEMIETFLDLVAALKRFELVSTASARLVLLGDGDASDLDLQSSRGRRVYEFGESARVINSAVPATVLFLDLRGFTKTSEGQISARDLTREIYTVFDAFVPDTIRFGGTIDKFLGDGMMVTFGTNHADPLDPLNAIRTAVRCQETLARLRNEKKTAFLMGIAIHHGHVHAAHFISGEGETQSTVIGRNVNLAGRLSSAAKRPMEEEEEETPPPALAPRASGLSVTVDAEGTLFNEGIAISRDTLVELEKHLPLVHGDGAVEYDDEVLFRRLIFRYAGDAKFKGVRSSLPVYEVDFESL
jgi:class 3 adenylate cyclase